ncbi:Atu4866 domain-containing protein [Streptomyces sp. NPDC056144]|uniref:Atu4866 domain-containing protein n=1 Tax=unclassified Streptomyces TaxID=2593676 RepID=UPI0035DB0899
MARLRLSPGARGAVGAAMLLCAALAACSGGERPESAESSVTPASSASSATTGAADRVPTAEAGTSSRPSAGAATDAASRTVAGVWASSDGFLRLTLRTDGTFSEDYNGTENAYQGRYTLRGDALELSAATGESASGTVGPDGIDLSGRALLPQR